MPSHQMEGEDYKAGAGALSGERIFGDADPATALRQYQANALWHGLRTLLKGEETTTNELTAASGAADQTEGYIRLAKAIRRSARRFQASNILSVTLSNGGNTIFTPGQDAFCFHLVDPTPTPAGVDSYVHPIPSSNNTQKNRLILIVNMTDSFKMVGNSYYQKYVRLAPRESCWFYGLDESGSGTTIWQAIGRPFDELGFSSWAALFRDSANTGNSVGMDMKYRVVNQVVTMYIPQAHLVLGSGPGVRMDIVPNGGSVPTFLKPYPAVAGQVQQPPIVMVINGTTPIAAGTTSLESTLTPSRWMGIGKPTGGVWVNGDDIQIAAQCITYLGA